MDNQIPHEEMAYLFSLPHVTRRVTPGDGQSSAYHAGRKPPNYPVPAIRQATSKINALNHQKWRWYWYLMGFNYGR